MTVTTLSPGIRFAMAQVHFDASDFTRAATLLAELAAEVPDDLAVRLLLARAYYHSAQLRRAETEARAVVEADPVNAYAHLLLGRSLERQSRHAEAAGPLRVAVAMGLDLVG